jgi:hypothetical protein
MIRIENKQLYKHKDLRRLNMWKQTPQKHVSLMSYKVEILQKG